MNKLIALLAMASFPVFGAIPVKMASEKQIVAMTLYKEARGEGIKGLEAVATVIYNRAKLSKTSFKGVCLKPLQFSCWNGSYVILTPKDKVYKDCQRIAERVVSGTFKPIGNYTHYFAYKQCNPNWGQGKGVFIGNHKFLTLKR